MRELLRKSFAAIPAPWVSRATLRNWVPRCHGNWWINPPRNDGNLQLPAHVISI